MDVELPTLREAIVKNGYNEDLADYVIRLIEPFVGYAFNRSHSAAYAFISFYTAYLKCFYPVEFYKSVLTVFGDNENKLSAYIKDAKDYGLKILPPDVNRSGEDFTIIDDETILFGLGSIKRLPAKAISAIKEKRPFYTLPELILKNTKSELNKTAVRVLAYSGAVDGLSEESNRQAILNEMFIVRGDGNDVERPDEFTKKHMLEEERTLLGVYMSGHPLEDIAKPVDWEEAEGNLGRVESHAVIESIRRITTKKGDPMAFVSLNFLERTIDGVMFPNLYEKEFQFRTKSKLLKLGPTLVEGMIVKVSGVFQENNRGELSFILNQANVPVLVNKGFEEHISGLEEEVGVTPEEPEVIEAPVFSFNEF